MVKRITFYRDLFLIKTFKLAYRILIPLLHFEWRVSVILSPIHLPSSLLSPISLCDVPNLFLFLHPMCPSAYLSSFFSTYFYPLLVSFWVFVFKPSNTLSSVYINMYVSMKLLSFWIWLTLLNIIFPKSAHFLKISYLFVAEIPCVCVPHFYHLFFCCSSISLLFWVEQR